MKPIKYILLIIFLSLIFGCGKKEKGELPKIDVDSLSINVLSMPFDICASDEYLFVVDFINKAIYKIKEGSIIEQYSSVGKAPGEFIEPIKIQYKNNKLFLLDNGLGRITAFNKDFEYLFSFIFGFPSHSFVVGNNENIFVTRFLGDSLIVEFDFEGNIKNKFLKNKFLENDLRHSVSNTLNLSFSDKNNNLMYSYLTDNNIILFDIKTKHVKRNITFNLDLPIQKTITKIDGNRFYAESSGTILCSDFKEYNDKLIIMCGGGFEENKGDLGTRKPIKDMKYYMLIENKDELQKFRINLPLENGFGYRFAILKGKIYFVSLGRQKIYYIKKNEIGL